MHLDPNSDFDVTKTPRLSRKSLGGISVRDQMSLNMIDERIEDLGLSVTDLALYDWFEADYPSNVRRLYKNLLSERYVKALSEFAYARRHPLAQWKADSRKIIEQIGRAELVKAVLPVYMDQPLVLIELYLDGKMSPWSFEYVTRTTRWFEKVETHVDQICRPRQAYIMGRLKHYSLQSHYENDEK